MCMPTEGFRSYYVLPLCDALRTMHNELRFLRYRDSPLLAG